MTQPYTAALRRWFLGSDEYWRAYGIDTGVYAGQDSTVTARFTASTAGKTITVDGSGSTATASTITSYGWDFGDGSTATGPTAAHTYGSAGQYTVTLTVTDDRNTSASTQQTVTISAPNAAYTWTASGPTASFDATGSTDVGSTIRSYGWDFGDGATGAGATVTHTYGSGGTRTVTLTVTDTAGTVDTESQQVTVALPVSNPVAAFTDAVSGQVATFDASASTTSNATITGYAWTFGDGTTGAGIKPAHTYAVGTFTATLTITDSQGRTASVAHPVTVSPPVNQPPTAAYTVTVTNLTAGFSAVTSTDSDGTITAYAWTFGDGGTGTGVSPTHTYPAAGSYPVRLTVTDNLGAQGSISKTVTVTAVKYPDYLASTTATSSSTLVPASTGAVLQQFVRSPDTGEFYSSQAHPESDGVTESTRISRMSVTGATLDQMLLTGAGHGTSFALEFRSGVVWLWLNWQRDTVGGPVVDDLVRLPYRAGTYTRAQVTGLNVVSPGPSYRLPAFDHQNGYAVIRTGTSTAATYTRYQLADVLAGKFTAPVDTVTLPEGAFGSGRPTLQGFATYAGALFRYTGAPSDNPDRASNPPTLTEYDWASGGVVRVLDTSAFGGSTQKTEPEGLSVYDPGSNPVLFFGVTQGPTGGPHSYPTWWYPLVDTTTGGGGGGRQFDVGTEPWRTGTLTEGWPATALNMVVDYVDHGLGFTKNLDRVIADYGGPCIVRLPAGTFHITSFGYSSRYGYFNANLRGLLGAGVTATTIKLDPGAMSSAQLADITANGAQGYHAFRIGSDGIATYMAGIKWVGTDQPNVNILGATSPCPYNGLHLYHPAAGTLWQNFACVGFGRAGSNSPPFETGAIQSGIGAAHLRRFEIDGRLDSSVNTARPRRSGGWMLNQETSALHENGWIHHTGRSGYSFWGDAPGTMKTVGMQIEHNANQADDGFGGNRSFGVINHETNGAFTHDHGYWQRDSMANSHTFDGYGYWTDGPCTTKYIEPVWAGGPAVDNGCFSIQIKPQYGSNSAGYKTNYWYNATGGWSNVVVVKGGVTLKPHAVTSGSYTAASLQSAGVTAITHFLIKTT